MTAAEALRAARARLEAAGVPTPGVDAEWLLAHALGVQRSGLALAHGRELTPDEERASEQLVARRAAREPLAYVLGAWGFRRLTLRTDSRALVPRPETETVVERCVELMRDRDAPRILDLGVGSGAIALALADELPSAAIVGVDASAAALALARENADLTGLAPRVELRVGDFSDPPRGPFDLVVSNPPYVRAEEVDALDPEVRDWEPRAALVGDGALDAVVAAARTALAPAGWLVLEAHAEAAHDAAARLQADGFAAVRITRDVAGRDRVVEGRA